MSQHSAKVCLQDISGVYKGCQHLAVCLEERREGSIQGTAAFCGVQSARLDSLTLHNSGSSYGAVTFPSARFW